MAKKSELKERGTGDVLYPITAQECVQTRDGSGVATQKDVRQGLAELVGSTPDYLETIDSLKNRLAENPDEALALATEITEAKKKVFIDLWNEACIYRAGVHGKYNKETGFFELNGITDIGWEEAIKIYNIPRVRHQSGIDDYYLIYNVRTCFPIIGQFLNIGNSICRCCGFEVIRLLDYHNYQYSIDKLDSYSEDYVTRLSNTKDFCSSYVTANGTLKKVLGKLDISKDPETVHFNSASYRVLEQIYLYGICKDFERAFSQNTVLKIDCWKYMIEYALNTNPISITVHPDIMAKLLGEGDYSDGNGTMEEWMALNELALSKNIQFATA